MSNYRTTTVPVTGGQLQVGLWGPEDTSAPTVLLVHGVTASHKVWGRVAQCLPGVRLIAPDLRGRGRSNQLPGPYGMPAHAADLAAVVRQLSDGPVAVAGHSMGAFASLVFADNYRDLVTSLLLVDGGLPLQVPPGLDDDQIVQAVLGPAAERLAMEFESVEAYKQFWTPHPAFASNWNELVDEYLEYDLHGTAPHLRPATSYEAVAQDTAELHRGASLLAALQQLHHPAVFLRSPKGLLGAEPGLYEAEYVKEWGQRLPELAVEEVAGTNHYTIVMDSPGDQIVAGHLRAMLGAVRT
ncbi:alpha/beta fold hydrolase [Glutamicibacter nicotianae]|uniref:alpha/beta fold hydrolase n=1 Tax=Glutamicibacter nicotianae TaxID=37929 RepID=UPI002555EF2E|nr:alpha/beta hydrolase [Glutamicibacter nicotianae]WIV44686.1 alpha/beta hydrolase [Glutamicibacter nicotianae]